MQAAQSFETELAVPVAGAATAWYSLSVRRAEPATGDNEVVAVLTDISRLKSQQTELEALARDRELMFSLSDVGIAYLRGGRIERANQAMAALTGYADSELAALDPAELAPDPDDHQRQEREELRMLRQHGRYHGERQLRRRDGSLVWVQVAQRLVNEADEQAGRICSYVDVQERHRAREELLRQAERTRSVLDSVLVGIVTVGAGGIEWMNRSARRMFGGELADFVGKPIATVATPEPDHPLRRTDYLQTLAEGQAETFECRLKARDGREFWVVGNAVAHRPRLDCGRQLTFALLDIERRRQAEVQHRAGAGLAAAHHRDGAAGDRAVRRADAARAAGQPDGGGLLRPAAPRRWSALRRTTDLRPPVGGALAADLAAPRASQRGDGAASCASTARPARGCGTRAIVLAAPRSAGARPSRCCWWPAT